MRNNRLRPPSGIDHYEQVVSLHFVYHNWTLGLTTILSFGGLRLQLYSNRPT